MYQKNCFCGLFIIIYLNHYFSMQVLFAYKKSFVAEKFQKIESILLHSHDDCISVIMLSNHLWLLSSALNLGHDNSNRTAVMEIISSMTTFHIKIFFLLHVCILLLPEREKVILLRSRILCFCMFYVNVLPGRVDKVNC